MTGEKIKVSCSECGTTNNFPAAARGRKVVCGRCKASLPSPGSVLEIHSPQQAYNLVRNSTLPVLLDFYSTTCAPCMMMHPVLERLTRRRAGELAVARVDVGRFAELAQGFGISSVPTFAVVHKGVERGRTMGAMSEEDFALWVASHS
jgi:thioredoxin 2